MENRPIVTPPKVVEYLDSKKITYDVSDAGRSVLVPASQVYSVRMGLASQGIPTMSDGGVGFELFDKPTFGMSDFMQRANYYRALVREKGGQFLVTMEYPRESGPGRSSSTSTSGRSRSAGTR